MHKCKISNSHNFIHKVPSFYSTSHLFLQIHLSVTQIFCVCVCVCYCHETMLFIFWLYSLYLSKNYLKKLTIIFCSYLTSLITHTHPNTNKGEYSVCLTVSVTWYKQRKYTLANEKNTVSMYRGYQYTM